jgi:hypothetical protein
MPQLASFTECLLPLDVVPLFAGVGDFDLVFARTGSFKTVAFCEINKSEALGNAIVPQSAQVVGRLVLDLNAQLQTTNTQAWLSPNAPKSLATRSLAILGETL